MYRINSLLILSALLFAPTRWLAAEKPNIIVMYIDDLGYNDIGPFGSKLHRTPNLDVMAQEGRRFTDFYVTSGVCTPSRSSLMTGCYPKRIGLHQNETGGWVLFPGNKRGLNPSEITMAEVLKEQGYKTACVGKWHLGDQPEFLPTRQGFDYYFGIPFSNDMGQTDRLRKIYPPLPLLRMEEVIEEEPDQRYITQRYTQEAVQFITENKEGPFFLYLPHTMPHWPQYSSENFAGKSKNGKWGDTVEEIDWSVGQVLDTLKKLKIDDNTITVFISDNGGATQHGASNFPLKAGKGTTWEGGHRVPMVIRWPGKIPAGTTCSELGITMDLLPTFAKLTGGQAPQDRIIDGRDIWPLISGEKNAATPHEAYYYYFRGTLHAVRSGDWKLFVSRKGRQNKKLDDNFKPELYNLKDDIGESTNVAADHPEVVAQLMQHIQAIRADLGDDGIDVPGKNVREPGHVENAVTLTQK
ncbi:MAG: arylsulfatase [Blastopirellula sp.]|nr:MAG: arylsulfatase [Blastopirellula sp.]